MAKKAKKKTRNSGPVYKGNEGLYKKETGKFENLLWKMPGESAGKGASKGAGKGKGSGKGKGRKKRSSKK